MYDELQKIDKIAKEKRFSLLVMIFIHASHRRTTMILRCEVFFSFSENESVVVLGGLIMNGTNTSKIVLSQAEFALWKRVIVEHFYVSGTSSKISL